MQNLLIIRWPWLLLAAFLYIYIMETHAEEIQLVLEEDLNDRVNINTQGTIFDKTLSALSMFKSISFFPSYCPMDFVTRDIGSSLSYTGDDIYALPPLQLSVSPVPDSTVSPVPPSKPYTGIRNYLRQLYNLYSDTGRPGICMEHAQHSAVIPKSISHGGLALNTRIAQITGDPKGIVWSEYVNQCLTSLNDSLSILQLISRVSELDQTQPNTYISLTFELDQAEARLRSMYLPVQNKTPILRSVPVGLDRDVTINNQPRTINKAAELLQLQELSLPLIVLGILSIRGLIPWMEALQKIARNYLLSRSSSYIHALISMINIRDAIRELRSSTASGYTLIHTIYDAHLHTLENECNEYSWRLLSHFTDDILKSSLPRNVAAFAQSVTATAPR